MGILSDAFESAFSSILGGGSSSTSQSGGGYGGLIDSLFDSGRTAPQKEAKSRDTGIYGLGSEDQYKPVGSTFNAYGTQHISKKSALEHLDRTKCYSGGLICPFCGVPKSSPSEYNLCLEVHEAEGYDCRGYYL